MIRSLEIYTPYGNPIIYRIGVDDVSKITYSTGTSGVEYRIHFSDGDIRQCRGNLGYLARHNSQISDARH